MRFNQLLSLTILLATILSQMTGAIAMNMNVAGPYDDHCSSPQTRYLSFHSPQCEDMLFTPASLSRKQPSLEFICQAGLRCVGLSWTLHRNMVDKPFREGQAESLPADRFRIRISPEGLLPGFYDLRVVLDTGKSTGDQQDRRPVEGVCGFGWRAPNFPIRNSRPADFARFWAAAKAKINAIPLDARQETPMETFSGDQIGAYNLNNACIPADYDPQGHKTEEVESCKISFAGPDGGRVYAWLAKPKGPGPFPAMLVLPGAGFSARPRPLEHARHGYLAIDVQIHGQDVDLPTYPKLPGHYDNQQYEPAEAYYYYNVHLRVLQAVNYLVSRPDVDAKRIVAVRGSQGGRLGIVVTGLDKRIAAVVSCIANSPNYPYLAWAARCNGVEKDPQPQSKERHQSDGMDLTGAPPAVDTPEGRGFAYYDPMNYAPDIQCAALMNGGLVDPASPPSSVWGVFNRLGSKDKTIVPLPGLAHDWSAEFDRRAWRWLDEKLKR